MAAAHSDLVRTNAALLTSADAIAERVRREFESLLEQERGHVTRWEWASYEADWHEPSPLRLRTFPRLARRPKWFGLRYGFDADGRLRVVLEVTSKATGDELTSATFWIDQDGTTWEVLAYRERLGPDAPWVLTRLRTTRCLGGRVVDVLARHLFNGADGSSTTHYTYDEDRVVEIIDVRSWEDGRQRCETQHVEYDDDGNVLRILTSGVNEAGEHEDFGVTYRRQVPKAGRQARQRLRARLVELARDWAHGHADGDAYALALVYNRDAAQHLPPGIAVGTWSRLRSNAVSGDFDPALDAWNPAEFASFDPTPSVPDTVLDDCEILNQKWELVGDEEGPRKLLMQVAADLRKLDWSGVAAEASPFAIFAIDSELEDLDRNLRPALSRADRAAFRDRVSHTSR